MAEDWEIRKNGVPYWRGSSNPLTGVFLAGVLSVSALAIAIMAFLRPIPDTLPADPVLIATIREKAKVEGKLADAIDRLRAVEDMRDALPSRLPGTEKTP